jgi:GntR family transcriptional repressor for pyruvate dehydrogenase complex
MSTDSTNVPVPTRDPGITAVTFNPLERRSRVSDTTRVIKQMIISGQLQPGDRLPPERILCEALQVSRPTLRDAMGSLVAMNILNAQPGSGTFVSSLSTDELLEPMQFVLTLSPANVDQLFEVRCALEPEAASLAAMRADPDDINAIRRCIHRTQEWQGDLDHLVKLDEEMHDLVVQATHNGIMVNVLSSIRLLAHQSRRITVRTPGIAQHTIADHIRIGQAIADRDSDGARAAMYEHLGSIRRTIAANQPAPPSSASPDVGLPDEV